MEICNLFYVFAKWASCEIEVDANFSIVHSAKTFRALDYSIFYQALLQLSCCIHTSDYIKICHLIFNYITCDQAKSIIKNKLRQSLEPKNQDNVFRVRILAVWANQLQRSDLKTLKNNKLLAKAHVFKRQEIFASNLYLKVITFRKYRHLRSSQQATSLRAEKYVSLFVLLICCSANLFEVLQRSQTLNKLFTFFRKQKQGKEEQEVKYFSFEIRDQSSSKRVRVKSSSCAKEELYSRATSNISENNFDSLQY